jgi:hypothetical protein
MSSSRKIDFFFIPGTIINLYLITHLHQYLLGDENKIKQQRYSVQYIFAIKRFILICISSILTSNLKLATTMFEGKTKSWCSPHVSFSQNINHVVYFLLSLWLNLKVVAYNCKILNCFSNRRNKRQGKEFWFYNFLICPLQGKVWEPRKPHKGKLICTKPLTRV